MKFGAISEVAGDLDKEMEPEFEKLKKKFEEILDKGNYAQKVAEAEVGGEENDVKTRKSITETHHLENQITSDDPKLDISICLEYSVYIKDNLMPEDDE